MPHFLFLPPILDLQKPEPFSFVTSRNTAPEERKSSHHFHVFVFMGVHFSAFGVLEHVMNAVTVSQRDKVWGVFGLLFCIMSLNFYWSKQWYELFTSCNVFCMQA